MVRFGRRVVRAGLVLMALVLVTPAAGRAQSPATGGVAGVVTGGSEELLGDVLVTLTELHTGVERAAFTTRFGTFRFGYLPPGEYELFIERIGFVPKRITGLPVRPGPDVRVHSSLTSREGDALRPEAEAYDGGTLAGARPGAQWLSSGEVRNLVADRGAVDVARLATVTDETLAMEGLPPRLSGLLVDGIAFRPVAEPGALQSRFRMTAFPLFAVESGQVVTSPHDVEWTEAAGGFLSLHTDGGAPATQPEVRALWGGSPLPTPSGIERGSTSPRDLQAGVALRGPLLSDSARYSVGVEARRQEVLLAPAWPNSPGAAAVAAAGGQAGVDLEPYRRATLGTADALSAFGRLDWAVADRHRVDMAAQLASMPTFTTIGHDGLLRDIEGSDVVAGLGLRSSFESGAGNDLRLTVTSSRRIAGGPADVAPTFVAAENVAFGARAAPFEALESIVRVSDALQLQRGAHLIKVGAAVSFGSYRYEHRARADGEYYFSSAAELLSGEGVLVRREGPSAAADWTTPGYALFAQDRWTSDAGVDLLLGLRLDHEELPTDQVRRDAEWLRLTGLANDVATGGGWRVSPRIALSWDVQREQLWVLQAAAGIFHDRLDPHALAEWQIEDGTGLVRRAVGGLVWPPVQAQGGTTATTLTLLGPDFRAPATSRVDAGVIRRIGGTTALGLSVSARRTENLVRRTDLNLLAGLAARDQDRRPVFGTLVQRGSIVTAAPGSGRRFGDEPGTTAYDEVAILTSDGNSEYWGVTLSAEHELTDRLELVARYTHSQTTDDWFGARTGLTLARPQGFEADEWKAEGTSDFDVPHRAVVGAVVRLPVGLRIAGHFRFQSGMPFTPGFQRGVDVSGDGYAGNDPAFIDPAIEGIPQLAAQWDCLQQSLNRFAARNSCRADAVRTLDLSAGLSLFRIGGAVTEIMLEAFDLLEAESVVPDVALYRIDPDGQLTLSGARVTLPLLVNPAFGEPLARRHPGRRVRLGLSLKW
jgi:hypothetical protein